MIEVNMRGKLVKILLVKIFSTCIEVDIHPLELQALTELVPEATALLILQVLQFELFTSKTKSE